MKLRCLMLTVLFSAVALSVGSADEPIPGKPMLTAQEAEIQVALFAHRAGLTLEGQQTPRLQTFLDGRPPMWVFDRKGVSFTVDAYSGAVVVVSSDTGRTPVGPWGPPKVDRETAVAIAQKWAEHMGIPADARLDRVTLVNPYGDQPKFAGQWNVSWHRYLGEVPFDGDFLLVVVDPYSGALIGAGKSWNSLPPDPVEIRVTADQAVQVAVDALNVKHRLPAYLSPPDYVSPVEMKVVRPNGLWTGKWVKPTVLTPSRIAYVVTLWCPETYELKGPDGQMITGTNHTQCFIWVDVENGSVLGGGGAAGGGPLSDDARAYQRGQQVATAFKELPNLPPLSEWPRPTTDLNPGQAAARAAAIGWLHPIIFAPIVALLAIGGAGFWRLKRTRRRLLRKKEEDKPEP